MKRSAVWSLALVCLVACGGEAASPSGTAGTNADPTGGSGSITGAGSTAGAGGTTSVGSAGAAGELPCELSAMLVERCQQCHSDPPKYGAPMPLVHRADLVAPAFSDPSVTTAVKSLARMSDAKSPMPQPPNPKATEAERALLSNWIDAGYPDLAGSCTGGASGASGAAGQSGASAAGASGATGGKGGGVSNGGAGGVSNGGTGGATTTGGTGGATTTAGTGGATTGGAGGTDAGSSAGGAGTGAGGSSAGGSGQGGASGEAGAGGGVVSPDDVVVRPTQPWTMPAQTLDQYVCYGFDVPVTADKRQLIQITPHVDNTTIVHHLLLLTASSSQPTTPTACSSLPPLDWRLLYGWAPGGSTLDLPPEAGYPIEAGETMHLVMQVHYSNLKKLAGEQDQSGVSIHSTTELRPYDADVMAFGSVNFSLPPHQTTTLQCTSSSPSKTQPLTLFRAWPHMHTLGTAFSSHIHRADGTDTDIANDDAYSFYNQLAYPVETVLQPGDKVMTTCTWDNSTNDVVTFGETTSQEMCFDFVSYYPRIEGSFNWILPAYKAKCQTMP